MSSSSRSIAAARQKRAGEQSQQPMNSRPIPSISSQAAFAQQYQNQKMPRNMQPVAKNMGSGQTRIPESNDAQSQQPTKISVSNAVGLITLRLGRLEQIMQDILHNGNGNTGNISDNINQSNMKLISDEVFENIVNRINLLESKILNSKNWDSHIEKIERENSEIKNVLSQIQNTLFGFIQETNEKFTDFDNALALIEEKLPVEPETLVNNVNDESIQTDGNNMECETININEEIIQN